MNILIINKPLFYDCCLVTWNASHCDFHRSVPLWPNASVFKCHFAKSDDRKIRHIDGPGGQHNLGVVVAPSKMVLTREGYSGKADDRKNRQIYWQGGQHN